MIVAAIAGSAFAGNEVGYIVSMGSTATMAMVIYFAICFGKITFTTLNAYGSFMSLTTIVSGFRQKTTLSRGGAFCLWCLWLRWPASLLCSVNRPF